MSEPPNAQPYERYGYYGGYLEIDVLENALRIAQTDNDRARAHFLIAVTSSMSGDWNLAERAPDSFEAAIAPGKSVRWYDDALFRYAEFLANQGRAIYGEDGSWRRVRDLNKALDDMDAEGVRQKILEKYGLWDESLSREAMMSK